MRILHLMLACFYIDNYSYQENLLPKYHRLQGHEVKIVASLFTFDEHGDGKWLPEGGSYVNEYGIPVTRLAFRPGGKQLRRYQGLEKELVDFQPDIIFIHGVQFFDIDVVARYAKTHEVTVYADNHADFSNSAKSWLSRNLLHHVLWRRCAQIIEPCVRKFYGVLPARVDFLVQEYGLPKDKVELLVMGADDERVEQAARPEVRARIRERYGLREDDFVIVTGGKIDAFKTQTLLLMEAVRQLHNPKVKLLVFGSVTEELAERVKALADGERVQVIGWIQSNDSYDYFAAADLAVFPGRHSVFWEQVAAQGIPMLVKSWPGTHHIDIGGNVLFLEKDSAEEIRQTLETLTDGSERYAKMKAVAQSEGRKRFLYSEIARKSIEA